MTPPRLGWYGDDFTGATDTLAVVTQAGLRAMLFLGVPTAAHRQAAVALLGGEPQALGIAGATRTMTPEAIAAELAPVGEFFRSLGAPVLHYKVCSTFDSAPQVGSIGAAVRALRPHVEHGFVAIVGGQPSLGRYCAFGNLFAAAGPDGAVERIDRHPTMSRHPTTPMAEADLRRHLAAQGLEPIASLPYPLYAQGAAVVDRALADALANDPAAVLFDVADPAHLAPVGRAIWTQAQGRRLLAVGASSVAQALIAHWREAEDLVTAAGAVARLAPARDPVFVLAGSLSPVTARQVQAARSFEHLALTRDDLAEAALPASCERITAALRSGRHVLACTAPAQGRAADTTHAGTVAAATARLIAMVVRRQSLHGQPLRRIGIAGGDTSSLAVKALGCWGLSYAGTLSAGVTVSRTASEEPALDGMELMLKGGQMGTLDVFEQFLRGNA
jgi:3-oxoisoapionate kinase